jgi:hypothetical protein
VAISIRRIKAMVRKKERSSEGVVVTEVDGEREGGFD